MTTINAKLVSIFQLLQNNDTTSKKFSKLAKLYGLIQFNNKRLTTLHNDFESNADDFKQLKFFTNTSIDATYSSLTETDQRFVSQTLQKVYEQAKDILMGIDKQDTHKCGDNCSHNESDMEKMLSSKKIQKMLKKKGVRQQLQKTLGKQFNDKNASLEDMLKSAMKDQLPEGQMNMVNSLLENPMVKTLSDKLMSEDNIGKIKDIFVNFINSEEIVEEINNIRSVFNEDKIFSVASKIFEEVQSLDDMTKVQGLIENNADLQEIIKTFEKAMESGLINQDKLMKLAQKGTDYFMKEFKSLGILDGQNMGMLSTLMSQFGGDLLGMESKPEPKVSKKDRRAKAQKKYRREQRKKLKGRKNRRRN